jgi:preprotein translocase subunit YajC
VIESLAPREFSFQDAPAPPPAAPPPAAPSAPLTPTTGAPPAPPAAPGAGANAFLNMVPFILIFVIFYFLLIRPQRRQQKDREKMISAIKKNDHVITSGGLCGIVDRIKDNDVYLLVDEKADVKLRILRSSIVMVEKVSGGEEK